MSEEKLITDPERRPGKKYIVMPVVFGFVHIYHTF